MFVRMRWSHFDEVFWDLLVLLPACFVTLYAFEAHACHLTNECSWESACLVVWALYVKFFAHYPNVSWIVHVLDADEKLASTVSVFAVCCLGNLRTTPISLTHSCSHKWLMFTDRLLQLFNFAHEADSFKGSTLCASLKLFFSYPPPVFFFLKLPHYIWEDCVFPHL